MALTFKMILRDQ